MAEQWIREHPLGIFLELGRVRVGKDTDLISLVWADRKGCGTKPLVQEKVPSQASGAVSGSRRKGGGVNRNPGVQKDTGSRICRDLHRVCSSLYTTSCPNAGAEGRRCWKKDAEEKSGVGNTS